MQEQRVELATGLAYSVLEWDKAASAHTVVLVHGFLDHAWGWVETVESGLAEQFHVLCPNMRGHGDSDRVGAGGYYHFMDYVADLASLIEQLGREQVSLVGHSMGGSICSYYSGAFPAQVAGLALLEGVGPPERNTPLPQLVQQWVKTWRRVTKAPQRSYASVQEAAARLRGHDPLLSAELALKLATWGTRRTDEGYVFKHDPLHLSYGPYPYRVANAAEFWKNIVCPVLCIEGGESNMKLSDDERHNRYGHFQNHRHVELTGAGHMMQRHRPRELGRLLAEFLVPH